MKSKKNNATKTVLVISVGFAVLFLITHLKGLLFVSVSVGLLGVVSDKISRLIDLLWMKLATLLSYIIPNILLSLIFYLFLFPLSVLSKVSGNRDSLNLKRQNSSLWKTYDKTINKEYFEKTW